MRSYIQLKERDSVAAAVIIPSGLSGAGKVSEVLGS